MLYDDTRPREHFAGESNRLEAQMAAARAAGAVSTVFSEYKKVDTRDKAWSARWGRVLRRFPGIATRPPFLL